MMKHTPLRRQRSPWTERHDDGAQAVVNLLDQQGAIHVQCYERKVHDGWLNAVRSLDPTGWHLSVSWEPPTDKRRRLPRYPNWDELAHARYELLPMQFDFVMHLPPPQEYVALHETTFHLHEHPERNP